MNMNIATLERVTSEDLYRLRVLLLTDREAFESNVARLSPADQRSVLSDIASCVCQDPRYPSNEVKKVIATNLIKAAQSLGRLSDLCEIACQADQINRPDYNELLAFASYNEAHALLSQLRSDNKLSTWCRLNPDLYMLAYYGEEAVIVKCLEAFRESWKQDGNLLARMYVDERAFGAVIWESVKRGHVQACTAIREILSEQLPLASGEVPFDYKIDFKGFIQELHKIRRSQYSAYPFNDETPRMGSLLCGDTNDYSAEFESGIYSIIRYACARGEKALDALFAFCEGDSDTEKILLAIAIKAHSQEYSSFGELKAKLYDSISQSQPVVPSLAGVSASMPKTDVANFLEVVTQLEGSSVHARTFGWGGLLSSVAATEKEQGEFLRAGLDWVVASTARAVRFLERDSLVSVAEYPARTLFSFRVPHETAHKSEWQALIREHPRAVRYFQYAGEIEQSLSTEARSFPSSLEELESFLLKALNKDLKIKDVESGKLSLVSVPLEISVPCTFTLQADVDIRLLAGLHALSQKRAQENPKSAMLVEEGLANHERLFPDYVFVNSSNGEEFQRHAGELTPREWEFYHADVDKIFQERGEWKIYRSGLKWEVSIERPGDLLMLSEISSLFARIEANNFLPREDETYLYKQEITFDLSRKSPAERLKLTKQLVLAIVAQSDREHYLEHRESQTKKQFERLIRKASSLSELDRLIIPRELGMSVSEYEKSNTCYVSVSVEVAPGDFENHKATRVLLGCLEAFRIGDTEEGKLPGSTKKKARASQR